MIEMTNEQKEAYDSFVDLLCEIYQEYSIQQDNEFATQDIA